MLITKYFVLFIFYSFIGWIYESIYCTIKDHSWQNRGFLYGPCVPIYGLGATIGQIIFIDYPFSIFQNNSPIIIFFTCAIGSFILEYTTSYTLEKLFKARWWDYSKMPLNINGRVCLIFTVCFGLVGVLFITYIIPPISAFAYNIPYYVFELVSLILMLIFGMDIALTISTLTSFAKSFEAINDSINNQIAEKYLSLENTVIKKTTASLEIFEATKGVVIDKTELTTEKLSEITEQLTLEHLQNLLSSANAFQKRQLRHIKKFTHPVASTKNLMEKGSILLKDKIGTKK